MDLTNDELGEVGQDQFKLLASRARMVANDAGRDRGGWDFQVEFQRERQGGTFDDREGIISVYVQVKATRRAKKASITLSLSAAEKLAKRPGPTFIVAFAFESDNLNEYDIHVIEMIGRPLADVLKALRRLHISGRKANHSTISFNLSQENRLSEPTYTALRARFDASVSDGEDIYIENKRSQRASLGYEVWAHEATLKLQVSGPADVLDILLGVRGSRGTISDVKTTRFGITLPSEAIPMGEGLIHFTPHQKTRCQVKVRSKKLQRPLVFKGWFTRVSIPGPTGIMRKSRFNFDSFEIMKTPDGVQLQISSDTSPPIARTYGDWVSLYLLVATVNNATTSFELEVEGSVFRWDMPSKDIENSDDTARLQTFETALALAHELGIGGNLIPAGDVYASQKQIYAAAGFTLENARRVRIVFNTVQEAGGSFSTERLYAGLLDLGEDRIAYSAAVTLKQLNPDNAREWATVRYRDGRIALIDRTPEAFKDFVEEAKRDSALDDVLLDELDAEFINSALGGAVPF